MLKTKKIIISALLLLTIGAGATLAYLHRESNDLTNTFKVSNVDTDIEEPDMEADKTDIKKKPAIYNKGASDAIIRARIVISPEDMINDKIDYNEGINQLNAEDYPVTVNGKTYQAVDGYWEYNSTDNYWYYHGVIPSGKATEPLFTKIEGVIKPAGKENEYEFVDPYGPFEITVYQESVQATVQTENGSLSAKNSDGSYNSDNAAKIWEMAEAQNNN